MINTQNVANSVSDKLKLIELGSLDGFIGACYKYIAVERQYFYTQVLANANLKAMIANHNFARLIFQVIKQDNNGKLNYKSLALLNLLKAKYNLQQLAA